jgi:ribose 1,5-bisphosphokinase
MNGAFTGRELQPGAAGHGRAGGGVFIAIAGPSGAGKDSLIRGAQRHFGSSADVVFVKRVITRPPDAFEDHEPATPLRFRLMAEEGAFALWWEANGRKYGLPRTLDADLARGAVAVANVSRDVLPEVRARFPRCLVVHLTASVDVLRERQSARGRDGESDQSERLARSMLLEQTVEADIRIENNGALDHAIHQLVALINMFSPSRLARPEARS